MADKVDELELERAVWPISFLKRFGIFDARNLDENSVAAFGNDCDFLRARRVDSAANDVARDAHRILQRLGRPLASE